MSTDLLEQAAAALGDLVDEVVFVGGATITLWITDPAAPPPRPTKDVDVIVEVATRSAYYAFEDRLRAIGFRNDKQVICRWHYPEPPLMLDAMPTDPELLGFSNEWQRRAFPHAAVVKLPSGAQIQAVPPPFLLATKLEAYLGRGEGDLLASRDWADTVALVDGREELVGEVRNAPAELTAYLVETLRGLMEGGRIVDGIRAQLLPDAISQARAEDVVVTRLRKIVQAGDRA
ncbi:MAG TPA: nucleotidyl transferase AbiEii/AbiGii toxin family protein [Solirubrobacterales bacterium]